MPSKITTLHFTLPARQRAFVRRRVAEGGYSSVDDYIRELIKQDQRVTRRNGPAIGTASRLRIDTQAELDRMLLDGLDSGTPIPVDDPLWKKVRGSAARIAASWRERHAGSKKVKPRYRVDSRRALDAKVLEAIASSDYQEPTPKWWAKVLAEASARARNNARTKRRRRPATR
ncbi:MAG TPA: hypothetical protein VK348_14635 [Planctomycetota bacterium]|nr:hypothetical protein [Planctomycetota bacterium]